MVVTFIHTADWQLGKPFAKVNNPDNRSMLQAERIEALQRLGALAREKNAKFIVVAGDLFDSRQPTRATVSRACTVIGAMGVPVYAIPGNHDPAGPSGPYAQEYFQSEHQRLAPNLTILTEAIPFVREDAVLLPCPLKHQHVHSDPTEWLRGDLDTRSWGNKPRIVLAHGSIQGFGSEQADDEDGGIGGVPNQLNLDRLPQGAFDYIALGDWHGFREAGANGWAWYSGTHESDRFPKSESYQSGLSLVVTAERSMRPIVQEMKTGATVWRKLSVSFHADSDVGLLNERVTSLFPAGCIRNLLELELAGSLSLEAGRQLEETLSLLEARLLRCKIKNNTTVTPTVEETARLADPANNPLIGAVAENLRVLAAQAGEQGETAKIALRELFNMVHSNI
jgi:DNA repair exonuclease SbcCD nuclease subunit